MSKKRIYLCAVLVLAALVGCICVFRVQGRKSVGHLGKEIVYFGDTPEKSTGDDEKKGSKPVTPTAVVSVETGQPTSAIEKTEEPKETYPAITTKEKIKVYDSTGTVVIGDTGFELYNYVERSASRYAKTINGFTKKMDKGVNIYEMIVPTSVGITFPDNKVNKISSSSQKSAIKLLQKKLSGREKFISLYDTMMRHRNEYIYFRTDHHWTQLGAYYAYATFCQMKGMEANALSSYQKKTVKDFLGTFYVDSSKDKNLRKDDVELYYPLSKGLKMQYLNEVKKMVHGSVISDPTNFGISGKYLAFICGDNAYSVITNKSKHDGSSIIVVKESFGNALIPFLTDHYEKVYVIDYRYYTGKVADFVKKKRAKEVLIINNISMTRNAYLIGMLSKVLV